MKPVRICPSCGEVYGEDVEACSLDGVSLIGWSQALAAQTMADPAPTRNIGPTPAQQLARTVASKPDTGDHPRDVSTRVLDEGHLPVGPGRVLAGRYQLKKELGTGGFGAVFEAEDRRLHKRVALKVLSPQLAQRTDTLNRFRLEAIAASQVGHESIVDVTDFDRDADGTNFIVMEYLDGADLHEVAQREGPLSIDRTLKIGVQVAFALDAAHRANILHRDLKPPNIYLIDRESRRDFVKIIDFGISKVMSHSTEASALTSQGAIIGTPHYMAPEQARGDREIDGRVDVYALGVILYELLTGKPPFNGDTYLGVIAKQLNEAPPRPSDHCPALTEHPEIEALILRALAKDPADRHASMRELGDELLAQLDAVDPVAANVIRPVRLRTNPGIQTPARSTPSAPTISTLSGAPGEQIRTESVTPAPKRGGVVLGIAALALVVGAAFVATRGGDEPVAAPAPAAQPAAPDAAVIAVAPTPDATPEPLPTPRPVRITSKARNAQAYTPDGALLGKLPLTVDVPPSGGPIAVVIRARRYADKTIELTHDSEDVVDVQLERAKKRRGGGDSDIARDW